MRHLVAQLRNHRTYDAIEFGPPSIERYSIILAGIHMWYWVDVTIKQSVRDMGEQPPRPSCADWLSTVVDVTEFALRWSNAETVLFNPGARPGLSDLLSVPLAISKGAKRFTRTDP